jgi:hypothetical protein
MNELLSANIVATDRTIPPTCPFYFGSTNVQKAIIFSENPDAWDE